METSHVELVPSENMAVSVPVRNNVAVAPPVPSSQTDLLKVKRSVSLALVIVHVEFGASSAIVPATVALKAQPLPFPVKPEPLATHVKLPAFVGSEPL